MRDERLALLEGELFYFKYWKIWTEFEGVCEGGGCILCEIEKIYIFTFGSFNNIAMA